MSLILTASQGSDGHLLLRKLFSPRRVGRLPQTSLHDLQDYLLAVSLTRDSKVKPRFLPITVFAQRDTLARRHAVHHRFILTVS
jgi:hypothetical protein